ncbi:PKD repeat-containing protein [Singulisphaera sp. GP187]|uniref:PKD domain-containing protein n=1 Tax=Singulisphaera sp. GP187 TaxID=1882752 RepID=UPI00092CC67C|nr:PKD domain-containing protein [Singulisphaera sp. GP187]SIO61506.1 PKD repeat-containing protein [Singulisphaera sp. GP187]
MMNPSWRGFLRARKSKDKGVSKAKLRLRVEALEDRQLMASGISSYSFDLGAIGSTFGSRAGAVANVAPTAKAGGPYATAAGQALTFNGSATDPNPSDTAAGFIYTWNFGDNTPQVSGWGLSNPSHVYTTPGAYTVLVTATDSQRATSPIALATVIVGKPSSSTLTASAGGTYTGKEGSPTTLNATATGGTGKYTYAWDLANNGNYVTAGQNISTTFPDNGTYIVGLRVTDSAGVIALSKATITVANVAPTATVGGPYTGTAGQAVTLKGSATDPSSVDTAAGFTYTWNFGDGSAQASGLGLTSPSHVYAAAGTYTVLVTATDKDKATSSVVSTTITIAPPVAPPLVASTNGTYTGNEGSAIALKATATGGTGTYTYAWDLTNNGTYATAGQNVSATFPDNGTYIVGLRVTDSAGVIALSKATITVANVAPTATVGGPYTGTAGQAVTLKGSATDPSSVDTAAGFTYTWSFGDGTANVSGKNLTSPSHVYAAAGTYTVLVTATDKDNATSSSVSTTITIAPPVAPPLVASTGGTYTGDEGSPIALKGTATGGTGTYTYAWDLANNGTYTTVGQNVSTTFPDNGTYIVGLRVTDSAGVVALSTATITVANVAPTATAGGPYTGTAGQSVAFNDPASDPSPVDTAAGFTYTWNFGDGSPSITQKDLSTPSHMYAAPGTYTVTVTATDKDNATSAPSTATVTIAAPPLVASTGGTYTGKEGSPTVLNATATGGTGTYTYAWDLTNNGTYATAGQNVSATFPDNGTYIVGLRVTDSAGVVALSTATITVANVAPTATVGGPYTGTAGQAVTLKGSATDPSSVDTAAGFTYTWSFGDGTANVSGKNLTSPSHVYAAAGTYTVLVTATDKDNATSSSVTTTITIAPPVAPPLVASTNGTYTGNEGSAIALKATATGGTGTYTFAWDLDNNGTYETAGQNVSSTFQDNGTYIVGLRVTDSAGVVALSTATITVANVAPTATVGGPYTGTAGQAVTLKGSATDPSSVDTAAGFTYTWSFGDGTANVSGKNLTSPSHVYAAAGTYTVLVTATDKDNATSSSVSTTITIAPPVAPPLVASSGGTYTGNEGSAIALKATATGGTGTYTYAWDLANNGTYTTAGQNVSTTFPDNGTYTVRLRVTDSAGVIALSTATITVANVAPTASVGGPYTSTAGQSVTFKGSATDPSPADIAAGLTYTWRFGDGTADVSGKGLTSPTHVYATAGTFTASLTVSDKDGGISSASTVAVTVTASGGGTTTPPTGSALFDNAVVKWQSQMITYGRIAANELHTATGDAALGATYYDSARVFYQIANYTGDSSWLTAVNDSMRIYRDGYVLPANGSVPGYWNFTNGLATNYRLTGSAASRNAVMQLATSMYGNDGVPASSTSSWEMSREVAYSLMANLDAESIGGPHRARTDLLANQALSHLDQFTVSQTASWVKPFMVALTCEALIQYQAVTGDTRVLPAVRTALNWIWAKTWLPSSRAFSYANGPTNDDTNGLEAAPDLNLLIAPAFGWVYHQTGDTTFRDRGDQIFAGGVDQAYLQGAKQFDQNYRWSFSYVQWRTQPTLGN